MIILWDGFLLVTFDDSNVMCGATRDRGDQFSVAQVVEVYTAYAVEHYLRSYHYAHMGYLGKGGV